MKATKINNASGSKSLKVNLPALFDISTINEVYDCIKPEIKDVKEIILDASQVNRITTPAIQLLISLDKFGESGDVTIRLESPSDQLREGFKNSGLENENILIKAAR